MNLIEAFHEFRAIVDPDVKHLIKHHPEKATENWMCQCYLSIEFFKARYPDEESRTHVLRQLFESKMEVEEDAKVLDEMIERIRAEENDEPWLGQD